VTDHPCKGLPRAARHAFEVLTIGQQPQCTPKTLVLLLERGLIERDDDRIVGRDCFGLVTISEYFVPLHVHHQFCEWASEQPDLEESEAKKKGGRK
jgi:hypothetical protein